MSGVKTVAEVLKIARQNVLSPDDKEFLKSLYLLDAQEKMDVPKFDKIKAQEKISPTDVIYLTANKDLSFVNAKPSGSGTEKSETNVSEAHDSGKDVDFSAEAVTKMIQSKSLTLDSSKIREILEKYVSELPKTASTYKSGDILIYWYKGVEMNISSLLSAGTKILDAIMYMTYKSSAEHSFIFSTSELSPGKINNAEISKRIEIGKKTLMAAFCMIYNQGSLPSKTSEERNLSKFIKETLFKGTADVTMNKIVDLMSSADPGLFPGGVFLEIDLKHVPTEVASRCRMSVAGNKAIRYAMLSMKFEKNSIAKPDSSDTNVIIKYSADLERLNKASKIVSALCALGSNFEAQVRMNPASSKRTVRKNLTLQLTCAIIFSLSEKGRSDLRKAINDGKIEAFKRDLNFYGTVNHLNEVEHRVLSDTEADFSELSVEAIKTAWGLSN